MDGGRHCEESAFVRNSQVEQKPYGAIFRRYPPELKRLLSAPACLLLRRMNESAAAPRASQREPTERATFTLRAVREAPLCVSHGRSVARPRSVACPHQADAPLSPLLTPHKQNRAGRKKNTALMN